MKRKSKGKKKRAVQAQPITREMVQDALHKFREQGGTVKKLPPDNSRNLRWIGARHCGVEPIFESYML